MKLLIFYHDSTGFHALPYSGNFSSAYAWLEDKHPGATFCGVILEQAYHQTRIGK